MEYQKNGISKKWNDVLQGAEHLRALENGILKKWNDVPQGLVRNMEHIA